MIVEIQSNQWRRERKGEVLNSRMTLATVREIPIRSIKPDRANSDRELKKKREREKRAPNKPWKPRFLKLEEEKEKNENPRKK